jgi:hypothetical protein
MFSKIGTRIYNVKTPVYAKKPVLLKVIKASKGVR